MLIVNVNIEYLDMENQNIVLWIKLIFSWCAKILFGITVFLFVCTIVYFLYRSLIKRDVDIGKTVKALMNRSIEDKELAPSVRGRIILTPFELNVGEKITRTEMDKYKFDTFIKWRKSFQRWDITLFSDESQIVEGFEAQIRFPGQVFAVDKTMDWGTGCVIRPFHVKFEFKSSGERKQIAIDEVNFSIDENVKISNNHSAIIIDCEKLYPDKMYSIGVYVNVAEESKTEKPSGEGFYFWGPADKRKKADFRFNLIEFNKNSSGVRHQSGDRHQQ